MFTGFFIPPKIERLDKNNAAGYGSGILQGAMATGYGCWIWLCDIAARYGNGK